MTISPLDLAVIAVFLMAITGVGGWFVRQKSADEYMAAGRSLPGWAVGLSIFGSYVSSISFLTNPESAYAGNWNRFAFAILMPVAAWIAVRWFVPFYRESGDISAYDSLARRFGSWARTYAVVCFIALQITRLGTIIALLAGALLPFTGIDPVWLIAGLTIVMTIYPFLGGTEAVIWAGVLQSAVLLAGPIVCLIVLFNGIPNGVAGFVDVAQSHDKLSLGPYWPPPDQPNKAIQPTFWVVLAYGFVTHLQNFGVDQSFVQRYVTAKSDKAAVRSVWLATVMYIPVFALFFLIGTALWVYYRESHLMPNGILPKEVFPTFIRQELPPGFRGLVLAALLAAAMDSNLTSMATLYWCDVHQKLFGLTPNPQDVDRRGLRVMRFITIVFAAASGAVALAMLRAQAMLDQWWRLAGFCSGGMLGLFLLGRFLPRVNSRAAAMGVIGGTLLMVWMFLSPLCGPWLPKALRSPFHELLIMVFGTIGVIVCGWLASVIPLPSQSRQNPEEAHSA